MENRPYLDQLEVDGTTYDLRAANAVPAVEGYGGNDFSEEFESAAALHTAIAAGDFSKIRIGDYYPITVSGTFHDAATDTDKTLNANVKMEVAAINPYLRFGDTELTAQHILMCSRDCLPPTLQFRSENSTWFDPAAVNPWLGSALYATLNDPENGIIKLLENTPLGAYIFKGPNNKGMRAYLETMAAGAAAPTTGAWSDRGRLFLPEEMEVYGSKIRSPKSNAIADMLYNQWPIFAGSGRHIIKGAGDGGGRSTWWLETAYSATSFCLVNSYGSAYTNSAAYTNFRVPLCFLLT
ncbi:MAG: hypothetical protein IJV40_03515 [Oscillospiraceae bacterium]|nr:hypothetical protein [Oscillospiraceae bacterium]